MHRLSGILFCLLAMGQFLLAQPQNTQRFHWWHFGDGWTLDFNVTPPAHSQSSSINQFEGCATLSDGAGRLLFYTDGMTVWQRNGAVMPNGQGLLGDDGSTMSAIITPVIGHRDQYYIFTVDGSTTLPNNGPNGRFDGLHYSVVDMNLNGGFGQVIQKNIPLVDSTTEKVIALKGANEREYWVVTQLFDKSRYHAYKVDCSGIHTTPVISNSGLPVSGMVSYGYMKPSHDGNLIASIVTDTSFLGINERVELLDFDRNTGVLSNPRPVTGVGSAYYGLEFSPNDSVLYVGDITNQEILSFDLYASNIPASAQVVHNYGILGADIGALQLGPDSIIYIKKFNTLDAIQDPDNRNNPGFTVGAVNLQNASIFNATLGLPTWFDIWPAPLTSPDTTICKGYATPIGVNSIPGFTYSWSPTATLSNPNIANPVANPVTTTTYTLYATNAGCTDTATVTVNVLGDSTFISASLGHFNWCPNRQNILRIKGGIPVQWIKNGIPIPGATGTSITPTGPGVYQAAITDSCGHPDTLTVSLTPDPPQANIAPGDSITICQGEVQPLFAQGGQVIAWQLDGQVLPGTNPVRIATRAGRYAAIVEDTCGLRDTATTWISYFPDPSVSFSVPDTFLLCPGSSQLVQISGTSPPVQWYRNQIAIPGATDTFLQIHQAGRYTVVFDNIYGCRDTATLQVGSYATLDSLITMPDTSLCQGDSLQLRTLGGGQFQWQPTTGLSCQHCPQPLIWPSQNTTYTVTLTDPLGCSVTDSIRITSLPKPIISLTGDTTPCQKNLTSLSASGAQQYLWQGDGLSCRQCPTTIFTADSSQWYILTGTANNGCKDTLRQWVAVQPAPHVTASGDTICAGDTASITGFGAMYYQWSGPQLSCDTCPTTAVKPGTTTAYQVVGFNTAGCTDTAMASVHVWAPGNTGLPTDTIICKNDTLSMPWQPANGWHQFQWSPSQGLGCTTCEQPTIYPSNSTTYTVQALTTNGCFITDTIRIQVRSPGKISISPDTTVCSGSQVVLKANGATQYAWSPATDLSCTTCPTPLVKALQTTTFTLNTTDQNGCQSTDSVTITVRPIPHIQISGSDTMCQGDTTQLSAQGGIQYRWAPAAMVACDTCANNLVSPSISSTFTVTAKDATGCTGIDTFPLTVIPPATVQRTGDTIICRGDTAQWVVSGWTSYQWQPATGLSCTTCDTIDLTPSATQTYFLTGVDTHGCRSDTAWNLVVEQKPNLTVNVSNPTICPFDTVLFSVSGAQKYQWIPTGKLSCDTCSTTLATPLQTTTYTVTGSTAGGCKNEAVVAIQVQDLPLTGLASDTMVCAYDTLRLQGPQGAIAYWKGNISLSCQQCPVTTAIPVNSGWVALRVTDTNGCQNEDTLHIHTFPVPIVDAQPDTVVCPGAPVQLFTVRNTWNAYQWSHGLPNVADPLLSVATPKTITVKVTDTNQCTGFDTVQIDLHPTPMADAGPDLTYFEGNTVQLQGTATGMLQWSPPAGLSDATIPNPRVSIASDSQQYFLTVTNIYGCKAFDSVWVKKVVPETPVVPNAFSPNGDGRNDVFTLPNLVYYQLAYLRIFNRWGQLLYSGTGTTARWDGTFRGIAQSSGTYIYQVGLIAPDGRLIKKQGNVTLLR